MPFVCPLVAQPTLSVGCVPTDGYHLPGCTWGNGLKSPRKVARRTRNTKHDRRGERQMPDPGHEQLPHRGLCEGGGSMGFAPFGIGLLTLTAYACCAAGDDNRR